MDGILAQQRVFCCKFIRNFLFSSSSSIFLSLKLLWDSLWCCQGFKDPRRKLLNSFEAFECELCARHIHSELEFTEGVQNCYGMKFADFSQVWNAFSVCFKIFATQTTESKSFHLVFPLGIRPSVVVYCSNTYKRERVGECKLSVFAVCSLARVVVDMFLGGELFIFIRSSWRVLCRKVVSTLQTGKIPLSNLWNSYMPWNEQFP